MNVTNDSLKMEFSRDQFRLGGRHPYSLAGEMAASRGSHLGRKHPARSAGIGRLHDQMNVVRHEDAGPDTREPNPKVAPKLCTHVAISERVKPRVTSHEEVLNFLHDREAAWQEARRVVHDFD
jgi:hypothetical protein